MSALSVAKNTVMTYLSMHLITNKTLELVYENAPECNRLKWKYHKFSGKGASPSQTPRFLPWRLDSVSRAFGARLPTAFLTNRTLADTHGRVKDFFQWGRVKFRDALFSSQKFDDFFSIFSLLATSSTSSSAIAETPRCRVIAESGRLEMGDNIYEHYRSIFNHYDLIGQQSNRIRRGNAKEGLLRRSRSSRYSYQSKARKPRMRLPINSNWQHLVPLRSYRSLLFKLWTLRLWATLWGLRDNVRCSSWSHWKARSGLPISDNWTFFAGCYGWGGIRPKIDRKSAISLHAVSLTKNFR